MQFLLHIPFHSIRLIYCNGTTIMVIVNNRVEWSMLMFIIFIAIALLYFVSFCSFFSIDFRIFYFYWTTRVYVNVPFQFFDVNWNRRLYISWKSYIATSKIRSKTVEEYDTLNCKCTLKDCKNSHTEIKWWNEHSVMWKSRACRIRWFCESF